VDPAINIGLRVINHLMHEIRVQTTIAKHRVGKQCRTRMGVLPSLPGQKWNESVQRVFPLHEYIRHRHHRT
jgi:hypothetical protein